MLVDQIEEVENSPKEAEGGEEARVEAEDEEGKQAGEGEGGAEASKVPALAAAEVAAVPRVPGQAAGAGEEGGEVSRALVRQEGAGGGREPWRTGTTTPRLWSRQNRATAQMQPPTRSRRRNTRSRCRSFTCPRRIRS